MAAEYNRARFISVPDAVKSLLSLERDYSSTSRLRYMDIANEVYASLNLAAIKDVKRVVVNLNPHVSSIPLPDDYYDFSHLSIVDRQGMLVPMVYNSNLQDDIADISLVKDCACECGCKDVLCDHSKSYETISEEVSMELPNGDLKTFTKTQRKYINKDGSFYREVIEPVKKYTNGVHTSTELFTTTDYICSLDVKKCGCIVDCSKNRELLAKYCAAPSFEFECGSSSPDYFVGRKTYNISQDGMRLIVPSDFGYDKVILRYYATLPTKDRLMPLAALESFRTGLKKLDAKYDKRASKGDKIYWEVEHNKAVVVLRSILGKIMLHEFYAYYFGVSGTKSIDKSIETYPDGNIYRWLE
jgi:hypothetical protein